MARLPRPYVSRSYQFRSLTAEEVYEFQTYARQNPPPAHSPACCLHPVSLAVWLAEGGYTIHPATGCLELCSKEVAL